MSFQPKPTHRGKKKKRKRKKKKSPPASPLWVCCGLEGWTCCPGNGLFAPHFSRDFPPCSAGQAFSLYVPRSLSGGSRSVNEYSRAAGCRWDPAMLPALQRFIVTPRPQLDGNTTSGAQRCLSSACHRWMCTGKAPDQRPGAGGFGLVRVKGCVSVSEFWFKNHSDIYFFLDHSEWWNKSQSSEGDKVRFRREKK